jgi:hypothetical protein
MSDITVSAVNDLAPLAMAKRVSTVFAMSWARSARPYATSSSTTP